MVRALEEATSHDDDHTDGSDKGGPAGMLMKPEGKRERLRNRDNALFAKVRHERRGQYVTFKLPVSPMQTAQRYVLLRLLPISPFLIISP